MRDVIGRPKWCYGVCDIPECEAMLKDSAVSHKHTTFSKEGVCVVCVTGRGCL